MANLFQVQASTGEIIFEGTVSQISNILKVSKADIYDAKNTGKWLKDCKILGPSNPIVKTDIQEHLFNEDGSRCYEYKQGFPNRYKGSSGVRFTPL